MRTRKQRHEGPAAVAGTPALLRLYAACVANAEALLDDARLLLNNGRSARAFALAFTAYEEIGKSQVVADAYYGIVSPSELKDAFRKHDLKAAYVGRTVRLEQPSGTAAEATIEYDAVDARQLFEARQCSLYVDFGPDYSPAIPVDSIDRDRAEQMIETVARELEAVAWAEMLNGRIGTKGLFK